MSQNINIVLNGQIVQGYTNESVYDLAKRTGVHIPVLCHDPRLEPYSSCYLCVVEIDGLRGLQPSCSTKIAEGMKITTDNPRIQKARKMALDLIMSNHYADCVAPCRETCPAGVDVQGYISLIEKGLYSDAIALIKEVNPLPAICGRVCVRPCEVACRRNLLDEGAAVGIDYLKRFAADQDLSSPNHFKPAVARSTGKKVAIIGAGPGGLSAAYFLQQKGHQCDIYEAAPHPGGWLRYGIPEYRLPNDLLDREIETVTELGVNIYCGHRLGKSLSYKDISQKYDATILTIGSQKGTLVGCEGEDAEGVYSGIDFLRNMEMTGQKYDFRDKTIAVVGGGNTAMDCCRTSVRCGADKVYVVYRRTEKEMPANPIEIHESKLEGVEYLFLTLPQKINKDENGKVVSMTCIRMELGEPDASGRRRPVPVEGSEFELKVDYILAAIGQKTQVEFLEDVNGYTRTGKLEVNRWGDIMADANTLQTGIPSVFAAGDGVTGPATIIEAIAQAKKASLSCHQFLSGQEIKPAEKEFISRKDHFKDQVKSDYLGRYKKQLREEMPTMSPDDRLNFKEVELGYHHELVALNETQRCLECGCTELYTCDLKKYSAQYGAEQKKFAGDYKNYQVDFNHPYIEIDNNKCILCARCVRICREVAGANALGLINRGFDTYVAPSLGNQLSDTFCESCGMCISTCPTGAITENVIFKPGPVKLETIETIDNMGSEGFEITLSHKNGFFMKAEGRTGLINKDGNINRQTKFGYKYLNDKSRILKPLLKTSEGFKEIGFKEAYHLIFEKMKSVQPDENAFFGGSRLTNEELYLIQKLARAGAHTNNIMCFQYLGRGIGYGYNAENNVPFQNIAHAGRIFILGSSLNMDHPVVSFMVNKARFTSGIPVNLITTDKDSWMVHKSDQVTEIASYYHFIKALNHYLLKNNLVANEFVQNKTSDFQSYKDSVLAEDFDELFKGSGLCCIDHFVDLARQIADEPNPLFIFSEKELSSNCSFELRNLAMLIGKLGEPSAGIIALKEKNNSQGIIDMGVCHKVGTGFQDISDPKVIEKFKKIWKIAHFPEKINSVFHLMQKGLARNVFIFGEDPIGCAIDKPEVERWFDQVEFLMVQDYFLTETAMKADLILPASFPVETGGTFTNSQKYIQKFGKGISMAVEHSNIEQIISLLDKFGINSIYDADDALLEAFMLFPISIENKKYQFNYTMHENFNRMFNHGCDIVNKRFDDEFENAFRK